MPRADDTSEAKASTQGSSRSPISPLTFLSGAWRNSGDALTDRFRSKEYLSLCSASTDASARAQEACETAIAFKVCFPDTDEARTASDLTTPSPVRAGHQGIPHTRLQAMFILYTRLQAMFTFCMASGHSTHSFAGHVHSVHAFASHVHIIHTLQLNTQRVQLILYTFACTPNTIRPWSQAAPMGTHEKQPWVYLP